jgi:hypothetical protein
VLAVGVGGQAVGADGVEAGVAEQFGDQDEVVALPDEGGSEGVAQDVAGEVVLQPGGIGDGVDDVVGAAGGQPVAAAVEQQGGAGVGAAPVGAFVVDPQGEVGAQGGVDGDLPVAAALAGADDDQAFAGGQVDVVEVEGDDLAQARPGPAVPEAPRPGS